MSTKVLHGTEGRKKIIEGVNILADAVRVTLGAKGKNVVIVNQFDQTHITKDGVTVARSIILEDENQKIGSLLMTEVANKTVDVSGDGTTTAVVLAQAIVNAGMKAVESGCNPMDLKRGIELATEQALTHIKGLSKTVSDEETLCQIATVSANNDAIIGKLVSNAFNKVGKDGVITVEESKGYDTTTDIVEGLKLDRGYISPYFVTDNAKMKVELNNPYILLCDKRITSLKDLVKILEPIASNGQSLLIIATDIEGDALTTLVLNKVKHNFPVCAIKVPDFGENSKHIMEDIAAVTGGVYISEEKAMRLDNATLDMLGQCEKIIVDRTNTVIIGGLGEKGNVQERINNIKAQIELASSEHIKEQLKLRLAKLNQGVAVIKVGGITETEIKEKKDRIDDALCATRSAVEEGFVVGGGSTLLNAAYSIYSSDISNDVRIGYSILVKALEAPFRQILTNGGVEPSSYIKEVMYAPYGTGLNINTYKVENLFDSGVIDPTKVVRVALENASSIASIILTTDCIISENKPKP